jgi:hypothetical protein
MIALATITATVARDSVAKQVTRPPRSAPKT